jgi:hypothetical protein
MRTAMISYRSHAKASNRRWDLGTEDFRRLTSLDCHYCGAAPGNVSRGSSPERGDYIYNGLDRVDSSQGYFLQNVVPACRTCNMAKKDMPYEDFLAWIARLASFHFFRPDLTPPSLLRAPAS